MCMEWHLSHADENLDGTCEPHNASGDDEGCQKCWRVHCKCENEDNAGDQHNKHVESLDDARAVDQRHAISNAANDRLVKVHNQNAACDDHSGGLQCRIDIRNLCRTFRE